MKNFPILALILAMIMMAGCSLKRIPSQPTPVQNAQATPTLSFPFQVTPTPTLIDMVPTWTPDSSSVGSMPTLASTNSTIKYDVDPVGAVEVTPKAGETLVCGTKYIISAFPDAGTSIWYWLAKQYGSGIPKADMSVRTSKFSQAYLYWIKHNPTNYDRTTFVPGSTFIFYLPCN